MKSAPFEHQDNLGNLRQIVQGRTRLFNVNNQPVVPRAFNPSYISRDHGANSVIVMLYKDHNIILTEIQG